MFGYVRPASGELKVKEFERFRACYCGLCHELGREYGFSGRMILNYDFVFLAMLLWGERGVCDYCFRRCVPSLGRRRCVCASAPALTVAAGYSVILAYWKVQDGVADSRGVRRLAALAARLFLKRAYKKASGKYPEFDAQVRGRLQELAALERANARSLDETADKFAALLASASGAAGESSRRAMEQLLYHVGRIIYIADGMHDLAEDHKRGSYNPVAARFALTGAEADGETRNAVLGTLMSSSRLAAAAFELLPVSYWTCVTENIVYLGIPDMIRAVMDGSYQIKTRGLPKKPAFPADGTEK